MARLWERMGNAICPAMGGLIFVEASKQIYAGSGGVRAAKAVRMKELPVAVEPEAI